MAPPVVRSATVGIEQTGTDVASPLKPPGLALDDYLLAWHGCDADGVLDEMTAAGFVELDQQAGSPTNNYPAAKLWGKVADAADVNATAFDFGGGDPAAGGTVSGCVVVLMAIQAGTYDPLNPATLSTFTVQPRTSSAVQTAPSVTGAVDQLLLALFATDSNNLAQTYPTSGPTGMTLVGQGQSPGRYSLVGAYRQALTSAGATGAKTVTPTLNAGGTSTVNGWVATSILVNPPSTILKTAADTATLTHNGTVAATAPITGSDAATLSEAVTARGVTVADTATETGTGAQQTLVAQPISGSDSATLVEGPTPGIARTGTVSTDSGTLFDRAYATPHGPIGEVRVDGPDIASVAHLVEVEASVVEVDTDRPFVGQTAPGSSEVEASGPDITVGKAGEATTVRGLPPVYTPQPWRLLAQRILTGEWLSWELPITDPEIEWTLSGTTTISGAFKPEIREVADLGLEPWGTWIHLEEDGVIRGSAIMQPTSIQPDGTLGISAVGTHGYALRVPFRDRLSLVQVDPADIVRMLWAHIQGFPRGNLGVQVIGSTPITIGTEARDVDFVTGEGEVVSFVAGPYQLNYWENTIIGAEVEKLAGETPFDFTEWSGWSNTTRTAVAHRIHLDYPQRGTRRFDLRFTEDENVVEKAPIEEPGDAYADTVYVAGKGEGVDQISGSASYWVGQRLRLPAILDDKTIDNSTRANKLAQEELAARLSALVEVPEIVIDSRHRNAPIGSFGPGDDIRPRLSYPYGANVAQWHRVSTVRYLPTRNRAIVGLTRRGEYRG